MKRALAVIALATCILALTGCEKSIADRVKDRVACEDGGGTYSERIDSMNQRRGDCDLSGESRVAAS